MNRKIRLFALVFTLFMQSFVMLSSTASATHIPLQHKHYPILHSNNRPQKAPANIQIPLEADFNEYSRQLSLTALEYGEYIYYIYNGSNEIISQGTLNFSDVNIYDIYLVKYA